VLLKEHWFTLRPVAGEWFNFNSLFPAPQPLSAFFLAAFLDSLREQGWTMWLVGQGGGEDRTRRFRGFTLGFWALGNC
jgi:hypothetical protein